MTLDDWWKALASRYRGKKTFDEATWNAMSDWLLDEGREAEAAALVECRRYKPKRGSPRRLRTTRGVSWDWWYEPPPLYTWRDRHRVPFRFFRFLITEYGAGATIRDYTDFREYRSEVEAYQALFAAIVKAQSRGPDIE